MLNFSNILKLFRPGILSGNKPVLFSILFFFNFQGNAQNLVPNPSFEEIVSCPTMDGQIYLAEPWFSPYLCNGGTINSCSSSDLYNECHILNPPGLNVGVPVNDVGVQIARTGVGYAGIGFWVENGLRERIEVPLNVALIENEIYCVKMFVVNKRPQEFFTSFSNLQFLFSIDEFIDYTGSYYTTPSFSNDIQNIISDTSDWVEISGCIKAEGGEKYLSIGTFVSNQDCNVTDNEAYTAYYLIDDVSVEIYNSQNCNCQEYDSLSSKPSDLNNFPNIFSPNEDEINDFWSINLINEEEYVIIMNRWGNEVVLLDINKPVWNGEIVGNEAPEGVYYYKAFVKGEFKTGFIQLVR